MTKNAKITVGAVAVVVIIVAAFVLLRGGGSPQASGGAPTTSEVPKVPMDVLVRPDSHKISTAGDGKATMVEFLDFECEACAGAFPAVEQLRKEYAGKLTYVVRYFPIDSHPNAHNAARAAEAAAQQGKFEQMYIKLFENQDSWGHSTESRASVFEGYAAELGLDVAKFKAAVTDPATAARIAKDQADGATAGVEGTPSFYLNGAKITPRSVQDLRTAIDTALAGR
ncbi:DsbA family protein [Allokutzneria albata]|uniref:Protein-disulfide isomerase n=1 Tax=Allokutzneria albata TaxID=211114 RepID=A0A1G9W4V0_ALLAB|nr:thioredoxin domain-containing protein [Allokutzneria albata]SDM79236.1 Protein-disulfide isomerase [Allokutzneria albata]